MHVIQVHRAEENKLKMTTEGEENEKKMKDGKKRVKHSGKSASGWNLSLPVLA